MSNVSIEIPKEFRSTEKIDLIKSFFSLSNPFSDCYLYVKNSNGDILDIINIPKGIFRIDIQIMKSHYEDLHEVILLYDNRDYLKPDLKYTMNDIFNIRAYDFVKELYKNG